MKKVVYVGDNRGIENWGCRATSLALRQLILEEGDEVVDFYIGVDSIFKEAGRPYVLKSRLLPTKVSNKLLSWRKKSRLFSAYFKAEGLLGMKTSILVDDPKESAQNIIIAGEKHPYFGKLLNAIKSSDKVIINGEGTLIFTTPTRRDLQLYMASIELARLYKKEAYFLNGMASECPRTGVNEVLLKHCVESLSYCTIVSFRDPYSLNLMQKAGLSDALYHPDALFTWRRYFETEQPLPSIIDFTVPNKENPLSFNGFDLNQPYICLGGSSLAARNQKVSFDHYEKLYLALSSLGIPVLMVVTCTGDNFFYEIAQKHNAPVIAVETAILTGANILGHAKVFVSGRFHPSILASLSGTPCVFLGSNSHKTLSLQTILGYKNPIEYNALPTEHDIVAIVEKTKGLLENETVVREEIVSAVDVVAKNAQNLKRIYNDAKGLVHQEA